MLDAIDNGLANRNEDNMQVDLFEALTNRILERRNELSGLTQFLHGTKKYD